MKKICILDYGLGNIKSLYNSLKKLVLMLNFSQKISPQIMILYLFGVGSFSHASKLIKDKKLDKYLIKAKKNSYIFGICLGMQILLSKGFENGEYDGLNLIKGEVKLIRNRNNKIVLPIVGSKKNKYQ